MAATYAANTVVSADSPDRFPRRLLTVHSYFNHLNAFSVRAAVKYRPTRSGFAVLSIYREYWWYVIVKLGPIFNQ